MGLNFNFCDVFFLTKKIVQKGVYRNKDLFLLWDRIKVRQSNPFTTTFLLFLTANSPILAVTSVS